MKYETEQSQYAIQQATIHYVLICDADTINWKFVYQSQNLQEILKQFNVGGTGQLRLYKVQNGNAEIIMVK